jgi:septum formation protein
MKHWSGDDLERYLDEVGETVFGSVGCYHIEAEGARLFGGIEGSRSTIMGMPMDPLLVLLQQKGLIAR